MENNITTPCVVCKKNLDPVHKDGFVEQPWQANTFSTYGTYGSEYFDPLDGSFIYLNICDTCLESLEALGHARRSENKFI
jgi:hypothetical protein